MIRHLLIVTAFLAPSVALAQEAFGTREKIDLTQKLCRLPQISRTDGLARIPSPWDDAPSPETSPQLPSSGPAIMNLPKG